MIGCTSSVSPCIILYSHLAYCYSIIGDDLFRSTSKPRKVRFFLREPTQSCLGRYKCLAKANEKLPEKRWRTVFTKQFSCQRDINHQRPRNQATSSEKKRMATQPSVKKPGFTGINGIPLPNACRFGNNCMRREFFFSHASGPLCPQFPKPCGSGGSTDGCPSRHPRSKCSTAPASSPSPIKPCQFGDKCTHVNATLGTKEVHFVRISHCHVTPWARISHARAAIPHLLCLRPRPIRSSSHP